MLDNVALPHDQRNNVQLGLNSFLESYILYITLMWSIAVNFKILLIYVKTMKSADSVTDDNPIVCSYLYML